MLYSYDLGSLHNERLGPGIPEDEVLVQVQNADISREKQSFRVRKSQLAVWKSETVHQKNAVFLVFHVCARRVRKVSNSWGWSP